MTIRCPSCEDQNLHPTRLEPELPASACHACGGTLLSLVSYRDWRDRHPGAATPEPKPGADEEVSDTPSALRCPKCSGFMTKYRVAADARNHVDLCAHCDEVWLDHGEWELLERFAMIDKLPHVFTQPWQKRVRSAEARLRAEERWREQIGVDYERARELREWLAKHPKAKELLAYLYLSQTER